MTFILYAFPLSNVSGTIVNKEFPVFADMDTQFTRPVVVANSSVDS